MKTRHAKKKQSTHFAQVPVKIVKQIINLQKPSKRAADSSNVIMEVSSEKTEPYSMPWVPPAWIR